MGMLVRSRWMGIVLVAASVVQTVATAPPEPSQPPEVVQKLETQKTVVEQVALQEAEIIKSLDTIEHQLVQLNTELASLTAEIEKKQTTLRQLQTELETLSRRHAQLEQQLMQRLRALYKWYRHGLLPIVLSCPSYGAYVRQSKCITDILSKDYKLFTSARHSLQECALRHRELADQQQALSLAKDDLACKRDQIMQARAAKTTILAKIQEEKNLQIEVLKELEQNARELQTVVDSLPQQTDSAPPRMSFSVLKGKLPPPVTGKLISAFGKKEHPDLHTSTFQKGIEIACPYGTEIKAIHDGNVVFADWLKGYGFVMIIDHGENYYSLLAHASKLLKKIGDAVAAGETIALVGDSYSLRGACLYFEIRHHGKPQNPLEWLKHDFT